MEEKEKQVPPLRATIRFNSYPSEVWKEFELPEQSRRYLVSNFGRIASFKKDVNVDGYILKPSRNKSGESISVKLKRIIDGKRVAVNYSCRVHNIVAENFIEKTDPDQEKVIHIDFDNYNNQVSNLRWANKDEAWEHIQKHPNYVPRVRGPKLNIEKVKLIKRKIAEGKTKQSRLAKQFGLSEMAIYRIKTGKNWKDVEI